MKTKFYILLLLLFLCAACKKDSVDSYKSSTGVTYQQSLNNWQAFKQSINNNYSYTVAWGSWTGFASETKLTVHNGMVTGRDYTASIRTNNGPITVIKTWSESGATVNTHTGEGASAISLDEIYAKAKNEWLVADKSKNTIYFETNDKGLLESCGYIPNDCQDDCFRGITVKDIVGL